MMLMREDSSLFSLPILDSLSLTDKERSDIKLRNNVISDPCDQPAELILILGFC